jgi:hypothetical protein
MGQYDGMGSRPRRRIAPLTSLVALGLAVVALVPAAGASASLSATSGKTSATHAPKRVQIGHGAFWECRSSTTKLLVAVNSLTLHVGRPLTFNFTVRNTASTSCNYVAPYTSVAPGPTALTLEAGPCGSVGFEIVGPGKHTVWPGPALFHCPALGFAQLRPGASVSGSGTWAENKPGSSTHVAPGRYTLVVDGHFRFPIIVSG